MGAPSLLESKSRHLERLHSERELQDDVDRLLWRDVSAASSFTDNETRDALIRMTIDDNVEELSTWLHDPCATETLAITRTFGRHEEEELGHALAHFGAAYDKKTGRIKILVTKTVCVVLGRRGDGFELFNAYPTVAAPYGMSSGIDVSEYVRRSTAWSAATATRYAYLRQMCTDNRWWIAYDTSQAAVVCAISEGGRRLGLVYVNESVATWEANHEAPVRIAKGCGNLMLRRAFPETLRHVTELWGDMEDYHRQRNHPPQSLLEPVGLETDGHHPDKPDLRPIDVVTLESDEVETTLEQESVPTQTETAPEAPETPTETPETPNGTNGRKETEKPAEAPIDAETAALVERAKAASAEVGATQKKPLTKAERARLRAQRRSAKNQPKRQAKAAKAKAKGPKGKAARKVPQQAVRLHRVPTRAEACGGLSQTELNEAFVATCLSHNIAFVNRGRRQMLAFDSSLDFDGKMCIWTFDEGAVDAALALWERARPQTNPEGARFSLLMTAIGDEHDLVVHVERNHVWRDKAAKAISQDACWQPMTLPGHEDWFENKITTPRGQAVRRVCEYDLDIDLLERFELDDHAVSEASCEEAKTQYGMKARLPEPTDVPSVFQGARVPDLLASMRVWDRSPLGQNILR